LQAAAALLEKYLFLSVFTKIRSFNNLFKISYLSIDKVKLLMYIIAIREDKNKRYF